MGDYLEFNEDTFELKVKIQQGATKQAGVNGCQVDDVIIFVKEMIEKFNSDFPCRSLVITELWLERRKENREKHGVEGFNKK